MTEPFAFDPADEDHARVLARLESEEVAWFGTIGRDGYPHAVPIWFLWRDGRAIILSMPGSAKVKNLRVNDRVLFHLEAGDDGEQIAILRGIASISPEPAPAWLARIGAEYSAKYDAWMKRLGLTMESMAAEYTVVIEITPDRLIAA